MKIKQLEWKEYDDGETFETEGFFGCFSIEISRDGFGDEYTVSLTDMDYYGGFEGKNFPTVEEAKAYCQGLLEKQVIGALEFIDFDAKAIDKQ